MPRFHEANFDFKHCHLPLITPLGSLEVAQSLHRAGVKTGRRMDARWRGPSKGRQDHVDEIDHIDYVVFYYTISVICFPLYGPNQGEIEMGVWKMLFRNAFYYTLRVP